MSDPLENGEKVSLATLLFVDDEPSILSALRRLMRKTPYECLFANSGKEALEILESSSVDVVISDMKMPEMSGDQLLAEVAKHYPETVRIVLSGYSEEKMVMAAINEGRIWGFIHKPWNETELRQAIEQAVFTQQVVAERSLLKRSLAQYRSNIKEAFEGFVGASINMQFIYNSIERAAPSTASVFIMGESGTGKEVAAQAIHQRSNRKEAPFIALNCAAIPSELMESEIFGHVKGAFSGAVNQRDGAASLANGGTLFLDELSEMDIGLQSKLLRFIQTGTFQKVGSSQTETVDIRFICATNREPMEAIRDKKLREDLYYRLNVIGLSLPPLRERENDAMLLAQSFLKSFTNREDKIVIGFSSDAEKLILSYGWPGNVRQLQNAIHSSVVMANGPLITDQCIANALNLRLEDLQKNIHQVQEPLTAERRANAENQSTSSNDAETNDAQHNTIQPLAKVEEIAIKHAIDYCEGNVVRAAGLLQVSPSTLYRKIQSWEEG